MKAAGSCGGLTAGTTARLAAHLMAVPKAVTVTLMARHSTEIAIFCPTFEMPKTVCECFKSLRLKT